jgi:ribosomal protein L37AE/L43A
MTMIEDKGGQRFVWRCDSCGRTATAEGDFWSCWELLKRRGWAAVKDEGTWFHACSKCRSPANARDLMDRPYKGDVR